MGRSKGLTKLPKRSAHKVIADALRIADHQSEKMLTDVGKQIVRNLEREGYMLVPKLAIEVLRNSAFNAVKMLVSYRKEKSQ